MTSTYNFFAFKKIRAGNSLIRSFAHSLITHLLICSFRSNQMSDCERFAQIVQDKWATVIESLFFLANRSFAHFFSKKRVIHSENRWANSQPWQKLTYLNSAWYCRAYVHSTSSYTVGCPSTLLASERGVLGISQLLNSAHLPRSRSSTAATLYLIGHACALYTFLILSVPQV